MCVYARARIGGNQQVNTCEASRTLPNTQWMGAGQLLALPFLLLPSIGACIHQPSRTSLRDPTVTHGAEYPPSILPGRQLLPGQYNVAGLQTVTEAEEGSQSNGPGLRK